MTKPTETLERIPLAKLLLAPENARYGVKDLGDIAALRASIHAVGDLIDPLHVYADGDDYRVWDGGRRLTALYPPEKGKAQPLPPALEAGIPCLVSASKDVAMMLSAATFVREKMTAADEFLHYKRMFEAGLDHGAIAAACSVDTARVRQLLRLLGVAPAIIDALREGKLPLDVVEAFSISANHEHQLAVFAKYDPKRWRAWDVKQALRTDAIDSNDRIAIFVGRAAYEAAGGTFLQDLFTNRDDEAWSDGALAKRLMVEKIEALEEKHKADGWGWAKFADYYDHDYDRGFQQLDKPPGGKWKADVMASAGVFIKMRHNGDLDVQRGWVKKGKDPAQVAEAQKADLSKSDPARWGFGHGGHHAITAVATEATRVGLVRDPAAAYDALLTHLATVILRRPKYGGVTGITASRLHGETPTRFVSVNGSDEFLAARERWMAALPTGEDRVAFCDAVAALTPEDKASLLAFCFADTLDATEGRFDGRSPARWLHLGWMAKRAGVEIAKAWTPDAEFLKNGSKPALLTAIRDMGGVDDENAKKGEMVSYAADLAVKKTWVPKLLQDFLPTGAKPKADRKAKRVALAAQLVGVEPDDEEEPSPALRALAGVGHPKPIPEAPSAED